MVLEYTMAHLALIEMASGFGGVRAGEAKNNGFIGLVYFERNKNGFLLQCTKEPELARAPQTGPKSQE